MLNFFQLFSFIQMAQTARLEKVCCPNKTFMPGKRFKSEAQRTERPGTAGSNFQFAEK